MSHIWKSHVTQMKESCHTYGWVMSHVWMNHVTHMNALCHTYGWVMAHTWIIHVTRMIESCHTYNESCHTYQWVTPQNSLSSRLIRDISACEVNASWHIWMSHGTYERVVSHTWILWVVDSFATALCAGYIYEWVCECVSVWVCECVSVWVCECVSVWLSHPDIMSHTCRPRMD